MREDVDRHASCIIRIAAVGSMGFGSALRGLLERHAHRDRASRNAPRPRGAARQWKLGVGTGYCSVMICMDDRVVGMWVYREIINPYLVGVAS